MKYNRKAQSVVEYTVILIIVLGVFVAISNYFKRGMQGRWKQTVDEMGDQYDPRTAITNIVHTINSQTTTTIKTLNGPNSNGTIGYWTNREDDIFSRETKTGNTLIGAY